MRPVLKKQPGDVVVYVDSCGHEVQHIVQEHYEDYGDAKMPLTGNIGRYCSYCESCREVDAVAVEHLVAKGRGGSETAWENFLLGCNVCNSVKGKRIDAGDCHLPHLNNTFLSLCYDETGRVKVNPELSGLSKTKAQNLLNLTHLNRFPDEVDIPTSKDYRWMRRYETWNKAKRMKELFDSHSVTVDDVIDHAKDVGYWSIWFTVFSGVDAVLSRLIADFPGTCAACFDAEDHYRPVGRNPRCDDPVL